MTKNLAVRMFIAAGVVLSALHIIWPAEDVRAGVSAHSVVASGPALNVANPSLAYPSKVSNTTPISQRTTLKN